MKRDDHSAMIRPSLLRHHGGCEIAQQREAHLCSASADGNPVGVVAGTFEECENVKTTFKNT